MTSNAVVTKAKAYGIVGGFFTPKKMRPGGVDLEFMLTDGTAKKGRAKVELFSLADLEKISTIGMENNPYYGKSLGITNAQHTFNFVHANAKHPPGRGCQKSLGLMGEKIRVGKNEDGSYTVMLPEKFIYSIRYHCGLDGENIRCDADI